MSEQLDSALNRAVLYLRQSVSREESISLELQESAGRTYAKQQGYDVICVESDPGISGRTWKRPAVQRVMAMIEAKEADIIILWKWSRLSRSRLDWAVAVDKVERSGGRIESATEPLDVSTSIGRLARGMLTEFAAFESERIGDIWRETHSRRIRQGLPTSGKPRFGYAYSKENGFQVDPITGPELANLYNMYLAGHSIYSLVERLNNSTIRPVRGYGVISDGLWSMTTLRRVLDSGFGAGFIRIRGELLPGAHTAVIDTNTWDQYLQARSTRRSRKRGERSAYMLSGLVRCKCGGKMHAGRFGNSSILKYRCAQATAKRKHTVVHVSESLINKAVMDWLWQRSEKISTPSQSSNIRLKPATRQHKIQLERLKAARTASIDSITEKFVANQIKYESYSRLLANYEKERDEAEQELRAIRVSEKNPVKMISGTILDSWGNIPIAEQREMLREVISEVIVTAQRPDPIIEVVGRE